MKRLLHALPLAVALLFAATNDARADALADFERAQAAYEAQRFDEAARLFERLVDATATDAVQSALVLESRKYLAASYLFLGREADAERQFELLVRRDPRYEIDPIRFPSAVVTTFERVRARVNDELERERRLAAARDAEEAEARERERLAAEARIRRLEELARTETVIYQHSRWIAALPFGIGQFQNGRRGLGIAFATTQAALLVTMVTSWAIHESLRNEHPDASQIQAARQAERASRIVSWTSSAAFLFTAALGILEAELHFVPSRIERRVRPLDGDLEGPTATSITLGIGPTHARFSLRF